MSGFDFLRVGNFRYQLTKVFVAVLLGFGLTVSGSLSAVATDVTLSSLSDDGIVDKVVASSTHSCALMSSGSVYCWGDNARGQLGDGTTTQRVTPVKVTGLDSNVVDVTLGYRHSCALLATGAVKCWGDNGDSQIGSRAGTQTSTPTQVAGLSQGITSISAGDYHTCVTTASGSAKCWGNGTDGALGDGDLTPHWRFTPTQVVGVRSGAIGVALGFKHGCALLFSGSVKCWGTGTSGALGTGSFSARATATQVSGLTSGAQQISARGDSTCAVMSTGGVKCWGAGRFGLLGDGATRWGSNVPVQVSGLTSGVSEVNVGVNHVCVILEDGGAKCWGRNNVGQLANGDSADSSTPVSTQWSPAQLSSIAAGGDYTCAAATGRGSVSCVGSNTNGQLGTGNTTNALSVTAVAPWPFSVTGAVTLVGGPVVGTVLSLSSQSTAVWDPVPDSFTYQWLRNGTAILNATARSYTITAADLNAKLTLTVTPVKTGFSGSSVSSAQTSPVQPGSFSASPTPTITGNTSSGQVLTAQPGTWSPAATFTYRWFSDGTVIAGANSQSLTLLGTHTGHRISVEVTGSAPGYTSVVKTSAATNAVVSGSIPQFAAPTVSGTLQVGKTVQAVEGTWTPGTTFSYQWFRFSPVTNASTAISGATTRTYTIAPADVDSKLVVVITGSNPGYTPTQQSGPGGGGAGPVIKGVFTTTSSPTISGVTTVGQALTANTTAWVPTTDSLSYQWKRSLSNAGPFIPIATATAKTYTLQANDRGYYLVVDVTGNKAGFEPSTTVSAVSLKIG